MNKCLAGLYEQSVNTIKEKIIIVNQPEYIKII